MINSLWIAKTGMEAQQTQLDGVSSAPLAPGYAPQAGALGRP